MKKTVHALALGSLVTAAVASASLVPAVADAGDSDALFITTNTSTNAVTEQVDGATTSVAGIVSAVAADGSGYVADQILIGAARAAVFTDDAGDSAVLAPLPGASYEVAQGQVAARVGNAIHLYNETTGARTPLATLPAPAQGERRVIDMSPLGDGVVVAVTDADPAGTTGRIYGSSVWTYAGGSWAKQADSVSDSTITAVAVNGETITWAAANVETSALSITTWTDGELLVEDLDLNLPDNTVALDLGFDAADNVALVIAGADGTRVFDNLGTEVKSLAAGQRAFASKAAPVAVSAVTNRLATAVTLAGVPTKVAYNGHVVATGSGRVTLPGGTALTVPAQITASGVGTTTTASGAARSLKAKTCFTAKSGSAATLFVAAGSSTAKCVAVEHLIAKSGYVKKSKKVSITTSASKLQIQVQKKGKWSTVRTVKVGSVKPGSTRKVSFKTPAKSIRVVAVATTNNVEAVKLVRLP